jgi:hypothetical protein
LAGIEIGRVPGSTRGELPHDHGAICAPNIFVAHDKARNRRCSRPLL